MNEYQLYADEFTEADQAKLVGFSCGDTTSGRYCTQWIRGSDVVDSIKQGTKVWLYRNEADRIIGYGSIGPIRWRWPPPDGKYTNLFTSPWWELTSNFTVNHRTRPGGTRTRS